MGKKPVRLWKNEPILHSYDAVIIGGGIHGLAAAYFLAKDHGMKNIAVLEKKYMGSGGSGRNTCIVRADQRTKENLPLHKEGLALWPQLISELDFNLMFVKSGCLNIAHSEDTLNELRLSALTANFFELETSLLKPKECQEIMPCLDISEKPQHPVCGGMYHQPGGTVRHDAVVWGLAKGASGQGVHIHQLTEVQGIRVESGQVIGVDTNQGFIKTPKVLNACGGYSPLIAAMVGQKLPITVLQMEAMVTEPLKPMLDVSFASIEYDVFGSQSLRGEFVTGSNMDPWPTYSAKTAAYYLQRQAHYLTDLIPSLKSAKFMRIWAGLTDMTPDMAAIMDGHFPVKGYFLDVGWGYFGFKSGPIAGKYMARFMATDQRPDILKPFRLSRFQEQRRLGELATPAYYGPWN